MKVRQKRIASLGELGRLIREDLRCNGGVSYPGFQAVALYRFGVWKDGIGSKLLRVPFTLLYRFLYIFVRNVYGIELPHTARIGRRFTVGHQHGITVHGNSEIGDDCLIRQGVTLGQDRPTPGVLVENVPAPKLGNRVEVGAGAMLVGGITIGEGVRIGPNAVVMTSVPAGAIVTAPPARIMALPPKRKPAAEAETAAPETAAPETTAVAAPAPADPDGLAARKTGT
jgi:serine O-acetyltransferase